MASQTANASAQRRSVLATERVLFVFVLSVSSCNAMDSLFGTQRMLGNAEEIVG